MVPYCSTIEHAYIFPSEHRTPTSTFFQFLGHPIFRLTVEYTFKIQNSLTIAPVQIFTISGRSCPSGTLYDGIVHPLSLSSPK